jgi:peptide deformylase
MKLTFIDETDPRLHMQSGTFVDTDPDKIEEFHDLVTSMIELLDAGTGVGLAAVQVGHNLRVFVMNYGGKKYVCIDPKIIKHDAGKSRGPEGCLSYPKLGKVPVDRYDRIKVSYKDLDEKTHTHYMNNWMARIFQHELDHLDGITIVERTDELRKKHNAKHRNINN